MVPVPEEYLTEIMDFVVRMAAAERIQGWNDDDIATLVDTVDDAARSLLGLVAGHALANQHVPEPEAAREIGLSMRETLGLTRELNNLAIAHGHPELVKSNEVTRVQPDGTTEDFMALTMERTIAERFEKAGLSVDVAPGEEQNGTG
jgi:hypothetical protein